MTGIATIGNKIAAARKSNNFSQAQLAEKLFISPQAVGKWERGESMPDILMFSQLAEILGVDLNFFSESFESTKPAKGLGEGAALDSTQHAIAEPAVQGMDDAPVKPRWNMSEGNWTNADFSGLKNLHEKFGSSNMQHCLFVESDLSGLILKSNNVDACDFSGSDFSNSRIQSSNLHKDVFRRCSLRQTQFLSSNVYGCDFKEADLTGVVCRSSGFEKNIMTQAVLSRASFIESQLVDIVFDGLVEDCCFENCAFMRVTFQDATLINTFFKNRTLKKVRFENCKADRITYAFLQNGGADLSGVTLLE